MNLADIRRNINEAYVELDAREDELIIEGESALVIHGLIDNAERIDFIATERIFNEIQSRDLSGSILLKHPFIPNYAVHHVDNTFFFRMEDYVIPNHEYTKIDNVKVVSLEDCFVYLFYSSRKDKYELMEEILKRWLKEERPLQLVILRVDHPDFPTLMDLIYRTVKTKIVVTDLYQPMFTIRSRVPLYQPDDLIDEEDKSPDHVYMKKAKDYQFATIPVRTSDRLSYHYSDTTNRTTQPIIYNLSKSVLWTKDKTFLLREPNNPIHYLNFDLSLSPMNRQRGV